MKEEIKTKLTRKFIATAAFAAILFVSAALLFVTGNPANVRAASSGTNIDLTDTTTASGTGWTYAGGVYTVQNGANVTVTGSTTQRRISVASNATVTITLDGATIDHSAQIAIGGCPVEVRDGANLTLILQNENVLRGGRNGFYVIFAGLGVWGAGRPGGVSAASTVSAGTLTISALSTGSLTAAGCGHEQAGAAGIGGSIYRETPNPTVGSNEQLQWNDNSQGVITIDGGTITATGGGSTYGAGGAGIGAAGNFFRNYNYVGFMSGAITINGGTITATGGESTATEQTNKGGAGIGGGGYRPNKARDGEITINGGTITATGSGSGSGIGMGSGSGGTVDFYSAAPVRINGGFVTANGGANGYGILTGGGVSGTVDYFYMGTDASNDAGFVIASNLNSVNMVAGSLASTKKRGILILRESKGEHNETPGTYWWPNDDSQNILTTDATIPVGTTLTVPTDRTLVIPEEITLTNDGTIVNNGTILVGGAFNQGTYSGNAPGELAGSVSGAAVTLSQTSFTYNSTAQTPTITSVVLDGTTLTYGSDYIYSITSADGAGTSAGTKAGTVTITVSGIGEYAGTVTAAYVIQKKPLTWTTGSVADKEFDNSTAATVTAQPTLDGAIAGDIVTVVNGTATFNSIIPAASVGITASGYGISGADAGNYSVIGQPAFNNAKISKKQITVTPEAGQSKVYGTSDPSSFSIASYSDEFQPTAITGKLGRANGENAGTYAFTLGTLAFTTLGDRYEFVMAQGAPAFAITKANAPTGVPQTQEAAQGSARDYSFDLTALLPDVSPLTLGTVTYSPAVTANTNGLLGALNYTSGSTLIIPVNSVIGAGKTATITVTISSQNYADFLVTVTVITTASALSGTVAITGAASYGETLTANTGGLTSTPSVALGALTYQWKRGGVNIDGAVNSTYTLVQADIGQTITVTVTAANCSGSVSSTATAAVSKAAQDAPLAPRDYAVDATTIILIIPTFNPNLFEYRIDGGAWRDNGGIFDGLSPNTEYTFAARFKETDTHLPSPSSASSTYRTDKAALGGTVTVSGSAVFGQTLTAVTTGLSSAPDVGSLGAFSYQWLRNDTAIPGAESKTYTLAAADIGAAISVRATAENCSGFVTSAVTAAISKAGQNAPPAFTLSFAANGDIDYTVTIPAATGAEYSFDGENWSGNNSKTGCLPGETVTGYQRMAAKEGHDPSGAVGNAVTLPPFQAAAPIASPDGGSFRDSVGITLSTATSGAVIYYTLDGATPTAGSTKYIGAFAVSDTVTVKAIAVKAGMTDSEMMAATFTKQASVYTVSVTGGTADPASGESGTTVTLAADTAPAGKRFKEWKTVSGGVMISDNKLTIGTANVAVEAVWEDIPAGQETYEVTDDFGGWHGAGDVSAQIDADHTKFIRLRSNGTEVNASNYTVTAGSTVITLKESYLKTLASGKHAFVAEFGDGASGTIELTVNSKTGGDTPDGGLPAGAIVGIILGSIGLLGGGGFCLYWFILRKERKSNTK